jgi:AraC-like DNA-binding protein
MPLSATERSRLFRERLKNNPEKQQEYKDRDSNRKKVIRRCRSEEQRRIDQVKSNERVRNFRRRQHEKTMHASSTAGTGLLRAYSTVYSKAKERCAATDISQHNAYDRRSSFTRAVLKVQNNLPADTGKVRNVITHIASSMGIIPNQLRSTPVSQCNQNLKASITEFYQR